MGWSLIHLSSHRPLMAKASRCDFHTAKFLNANIYSFGGSIKETVIDQKQRLWKCSGFQEAKGAWKPYTGSGTGAEKRPEGLYWVRWQNWNGQIEVINTDNHGYIRDSRILGKCTLQYLGVKDHEELIIKCFRKNTRVFICVHKLVYKETCIHVSVVFIERAGHTHAEADSKPE